MILDPPQVIQGNLDKAFVSLVEHDQLYGYRGTDNGDGTTTVYEWIERDGTAMIPTLDQIKAAGG